MAACDTTLGITTREKNLGSQRQEASSNIRSIPQQNQYTAWESRADLEGHLMLRFEKTIFAKSR